MSNIIPDHITSREEAISWLHRHGYSVDMAKTEADAWEAGYAPVIEEAAEEIEEIVDEEDEEEWEEYDLEAMTKDELEELGREYGIELDKRKSKATLIEEVEEAINNWEEDES